MLRAAPVKTHCPGLRAQKLWEAFNKEVWLSDEVRALGATQGRRIFRWLTKWYLRIEKLVIPDRWRYRFWVRPNPTDLRAYL